MRTFNPKTLLVTSLFAFATSACEEEFDPGSRVTSFRVLAVSTDAPFARPGESVHFEALAVEPLGRTVTWGWASCVNPASSAVMGCLEQVAAEVAAGNTSNVTIGPDQNFDFMIPADALASLPVAARPSAIAGAVSVACPGTLSIAASEAMPFSCRDADSGREFGLDEFVVGLKRVTLRETDRNQNPSIASVTFDGEPWLAEDVKEVDSCNTDGNTYDDCKGDARHRIAAFVTAESVESGRDEFGEAFEEQVVIQHYATEGIFEDEVRVADDPETGWVARRSASGSELTLWFVARDDRGGVTWTERRVRVR